MDLAELNFHCAEFLRPAEHMCQTTPRAACAGGGGASRTRAQTGPGHRAPLADDDGAAVNAPEEEEEEEDLQAALSSPENAAFPLVLNDREAPLFGRHKGSPADCGARCVLVDTCTSLLAGITYRTALAAHQRAAAKLVSNFRRGLVLRGACCLLLHAERQQQQRRHREGRAASAWCAPVLRRGLRALCDLHEEMRAALRLHLYKRSPHCATHFERRTSEVCAEIEAGHVEASGKRRVWLRRRTDGCGTGASENGAACERGRHFRSRLCTLVGDCVREKSTAIEYHPGDDILHACARLLKLIGALPARFGDALLMTHLMGYACIAQEPRCPTCKKN